MPHQLLVRDGVRHMIFDIGHPPLSLFLILSGWLRGRRHQRAACDPPTQILACSNKPSARGQLPIDRLATSSTTEKFCDFYVLFGQRSARVEAGGTKHIQGPR